MPSFAAIVRFPLPTVLQTSQMQFLFSLSSPSLIEALFVIRFLLFLNKAKFFQILSPDPQFPQ